MRITFISPQFPPEVCGVGDYTYCLARTASAEGHEAVILTSMEHASQTLGSGIRTIPALQGGILRRLVALLRITYKTRPDILSLQYTPHLYGRFGLAPGISLLPLLVRTLTGVPVVTTFHETYSPLSRNVGRAGLSIVHRLQTVVIGASSSRILVNTVQDKAILNKLLPWKAGRITYVPNGSSIERRPLSATERENVKNRWGLGSGPVLTTFGTVRPDKDLFTVVRALAMLDPGLNVKLLCVGAVGVHTGSLAQAHVMEEIARLGIDDRVIWTGPLSAEEVSACLSAADVFLFPRRGGPSGKKSSLIPAFAHGLPVVAFSGPETAPELVDRRCITLVPPENPEALKAEIMQLINDETSRKERGQDALELNERSFSWKRILAYTVEVDPSRT